MSAVIISHISKTYSGGVQALDDVSLEIHEGEIFALLGPNGAGKTTLIGLITGAVKKTGDGEVSVFGHDIVLDWRESRKLIGYVPQEVHLDIFLTVEETIQNQRGYYGKRRDRALEEKTLRSLGLWEKRNTEARALSGGMKRRLLIAKALMNEPKVLFLDEPTAGVDVDLRKDMWRFIQDLKAKGVTTILTTHYIEEAELLADRIGIIDNGKLLLVDDKVALIDRLGEKTIIFHMKEPVREIPQSLKERNFLLSENKRELRYQYSVGSENPVSVIREVENAGLVVGDISTKATSLEEIFTNFIHTQ